MPVTSVDIYVIMANDHEWSEPVAARRNKKAAEKLAEKLKIKEPKPCGYSVKKVPMLEKFNG